MSDKLNLVFKNITEIDPPEKLAGTILHKISLERSRQENRKLLLSRLGLAGSFFILLYTSSVFGKSILASDFWSLASLMFSDLSIVMKNWQGFVYSLLETMPVVSIIAMLVPILISLIFANLYFNLIHEKSYRLKKL